MVSDAQKRARNAYMKKHVKQVVVRFYPGEEDAAMYEWIRSQPNSTAYLKALVRADMDEKELARRSDEADDARNRAAADS